MLIHGPNVLVKMDQRAYEQLAQSRIVIALKVVGDEHAKIMIRNPLP